MTVNLSPPSPADFCTRLWTRLHQICSVLTSFISPPKNHFKALKLLRVAAVELCDVTEELTAGRSVNPLTPELNPSKQCCLPEYFTEAFKF